MCRRLFLFFLCLLSASTAFCQQREIDSLEKIISGSYHDTVKVSALLSLADLLTGLDARKAVEKSRLAMSISEKINYANGKLNAGVMLSNSLHRLGHSREALEEALISLKTANAINNKRRAAALEVNIGLIYEELSMPDSALQHQLNALEIFKALNNKTGMGKCLNNIGLVYYSMADYSTALDYYMQAMKMREEAADKRGMAITLKNIANVYNVQKMYPEAISCNLKAVALEKENHDIRRESIAHNNLAGVYLDIKDYKKASSHLDTALRLREKVGNKGPIARTLNLIGQLNKETGNINGAKEAWDKALLYAVAAEDKEMIITINISYAILEIEKKKYSVAIPFLEKALNIAKESKSPEGIYKAYQNLATAYRGMGNMQKAYDNYYLYTTMKDSIFNETSMKKLAEMQTKYESERKSNEIKELKLKNEVSELQGQVQERELKKQLLINYLIAGGLLACGILMLFVLKNYREKKRALVKLAEQNAIIEEKNKDITDSINYAEKLQSAIMPEESGLISHFTDGFILFKPKDIVSGDFYWFEEATAELPAYLAVADCTGHGVPGALMSMLSSAALSQVVNDKSVNGPADALSQLDRQIIKALRQYGQESTKDGLDIAFFEIDRTKMVARFAGANRPGWLFRKGHLEELPPNKFAIGGHYEGDKIFTSHEIAIEKGDRLYLFTDGFADQFGGIKGKKMMTKNFRNALTSMQSSPLSSHKEQLTRLFNEWKGNFEQVDDVCVIGIEI